MAVFKHIMVPLDGSQLAECVLPHLIALTDEETRVTLTRVIDIESDSGTEQPVSPLDWQILRAEVEAYLENTANTLREGNIPQVEYIILEGQPAESVIEYAHRNEVNLILLSSHGKSGVSRWNVSSVVRKIVDRSLLSTMVVRAYNFTPIDLVGVQYERIMVPLDGSMRSEITLSTAASLAQRYGAQLILTHIITRPELIQRMPPTAEDQELSERVIERAQENANRYFEQLRTQVAAPFESQIHVSTDVTNTLQRITAKQEIDLIILSAHGHSADPMRSYGNVTGALIEYGTTALITIQDLSPDEIAPNRAEEAARQYKGHS
jgi:nucleotide-binding universal stress UspA family protein